MARSNYENVQEQINGTILYDNPNRTMSTNFIDEQTLSETIENYKIIEVFFRVSTSYAYSIRLQVKDKNEDTNELTGFVAGYNVSTANYIYTYGARIRITGTSITLDRMSQTEFKNSNTWTTVSHNGYISRVIGYK